MTIVEDGTGNGYNAQVTKDNELKTTGELRTIQHNTSRLAENAYQIVGTSTLSSGTITGLHIKNTSSTKILVVTYIRHQIVGSSGGTSFPNTSNYLSIGLGRTYSSGGATATAVNVNGGSVVTAEITAYQTVPTLAGTASEIDRWYTKADGDMNTFNKEGSLILQPNQTIELSYVTDKSAGTLYTRLSFIMVDKP